MLPSEIIVDLSGARVPVIQRDGIDELGYWDNDNSEIVINSNQPEAGKVLILIHEMIHAAEDQLLAYGVLDDEYAKHRDAVGEQLVTHLAPLLFQWMAVTGMLTVISPSKAEDFIGLQIASQSDAERGS